MIELKINFTQIRQRVAAAESLQESGEQSEAKTVIRKLAKDILKKVKEDAA